MVAWSRGLFSRRQFLGSVGAAGAALVLPLPRGGPPAELGRGVTSVADAKRAAPAPLPASFSEDFSREFAGSRLWRWETSHGVRVFGAMVFGRAALGGVELDDPEILRGHGMVVALEGRAPGDPASIAGRMRTVDSFSFEAGRRYLLEFRVAGSHLRGPLRALARSIEARVPGVGAHTTVRLPCSAGFRPVRLEFTPTRTTASPIEFASCGAPGYGGLLLDSVHLSEAA